MIFCSEWKFGKVPWWRWGSRMVMGKRTGVLTQGDLSDALSSDLTRCTGSFGLPLSAGPLQHINTAQHRVRGSNNNKNGQGWHYIFFFSTPLYMEKVHLFFFRQIAYVTVFTPPALWVATFSL